MIFKGKWCHSLMGYTSWISIRQKLKGFPMGFFHMFPMGYFRNGVSDYSSVI